MSKPLDFNKVKKSYLTVTFADEKKTTIMIGSPTKAIMDELNSLNDQIQELKENTDNGVDSELDELYTTCAKLMSRNKCNVKITKEYLAEIFDVEDIVIFFTAYQEFLSTLTSSKN